MNKKVSTLLTVGLMLGGSLLSSSAFAHTPEYRTIRTYAGITAVDATINHITADKWYQLRTTMIDKQTGEKISALLVQERDQQTGKLYLKAVPEKECYNVYLLPSLWRIKYTEKDGVGGGKFTFVNKETNMELSYDHTFSAALGSGMTKDNAVLEACNTTWEWYNNNSQSLKFDQVEPYSYTDTGNDQVMVMKMDEDGFIYSVVGKSSEMLDNHGVLDAIKAVKIQPVVATAIVLNAQDFNSMIDFNKASMKQNAGFKFYKPNGDLLNAQELTNIVSGGIMDEDMTYHAENNINELFRIQQEAYRELGGKENLKSYQDAFEKADAEKNVATENNRKATSELSEARLSLKNRYNELTAANEVYEQALEESKGTREIIDNAVENGAKELSRFDGHISLMGLMVNPGYEPKAAKKTAEDAIASYNAETNPVLKAYAGIKASKAIVDFYKCYHLPSGSTYEELWARIQSGATLDVVSTYEKLDGLNYAYNEKRAADGSYSDAKKNVDEKYAIYEKSIADLGKASDALAAAKDALNSILDKLSANTNYIINDGYLRLKNVESEKYLMVDTAFWQTNQVPSKADLKIVHSSPKATDDEAISARYFFKTTYFPTQDSLVIEPLNASAISDAEYENKTPWADSYAGQNFVYAGDLTAKASAASNTHTAKGEGSNLPIVLKLDELNTSDLCLTAARANIAAHSYLKTRIAFNNLYDYLERTSLKEGLYFIKSKKTGKYIVANMSGKLQYDVEEANAQDYNDMPATMFVVEKAGCKKGTRMKVHNREYGIYNVLPAFEGQFYKHKEDGSIYIINKKDYQPYFAYDQKLPIDDDFEFIPVTAEEALTCDKHGYKFLDPETLPYTEYALHYNLAANSNIYLNVDGDKFVKGSEGKNTYYQLETVNPVTGRETVINAFGYGAGIMDETNGKELKELERQAYVLKVRDANLVDNDTTYVALVKEAGQNEYYKAMGIKDIRAGKGQIAQFYLKADQRNDGTKYYALVDTRLSSYWADVANGVRQAKYTDANGFVSYVDLDNEPTERASAFALETNDRPLYRTMPEGNINLYRENGGAEQNLFEDKNNQTGASSVISNFGYLGLLQEKMAPNGEGSTSALQVDPIVNQHARMPQYMLAVAMNTIADGYWCSNNTHGYFGTKDEAESKDKNHYVFYNGYTAGRFLVNLADSVTVGSHAYHKPDQFTYNGRAVRLGFVEGVHMNITVDEAAQISEFLNKDIKAGEYFFTLLNGLKLKDLQNEAGYIIPEKLFDEKNTKMNAYTTGKHNDWSFSFRLIDETQEDKFLIESNLDNVSSIGSMQGAWIKIVNGCPVLNKINGDHETVDGYGLLSDNITDGEIFSVKSTDEVATSNEGISTSDVVVVAQDGSVVVKNAAGKNVVVSTILGQVVANEVLTSDNATINVPTGIVVVAVEGESFKVNVK
ncbi:MAG: DUF6383 domain-containing protein [Parabacteroides sp.]|nr:DUF6383 domain-containing protein [Parabacteroides sp.]